MKQMKQMKQRSKRANSTSKRIRRVVRMILKETSGEVSLTELKDALQSRLGETLRSDYLQVALISDPELELIFEENILVAMRNREVKGMAHVEKSKKRLSPEEFTLLAIKRLSGPPHKAIHSVYSGFNTAFRTYFPGLDPVKEVNALAEKGIVSIRPVKGGVLIFAGKGNTSSEGAAVKALKKMGLE